MAEGDIDPDRFDAIVLGTGLPESILAAAAASSGRKVLHLDSSDFYGSEWTSMPLDQLQSFIASLSASNGAMNPRCPAGPDDPVLEEVELWRDEFLYSDGRASGSMDGLGASRSYSLDITAPKVLLCAGSLVDLLVKCGASNYLEFKAMQGTYVWTGNGFIAAPTGSSDLFQDRSLALRDKRRLMRFLKSVQAFVSREEEGEGDGSGFCDEDLKGSFVEFLEKEQLPQTIQSWVILYAIALLEENQKTSNSPASALEGLNLLKLHMSSIGRFENTGAFLYTLYGQAEIPQAFCRVAAVQGALYVLRRPVSSIILDKQTKQYKGLRTESGQLLYSDKLILGASFNKWGRHLTQRPDIKHQSLSLGRCVCITDASLLSGKSNFILIFPPRSLSGESNPHPVRALQLGSSTAVCPDGKFIIHLSTLAESGPVAKAVLDQVLQVLLFLPGSEEDLTSVIEPETCKPKLLWSGFFAEKLHSTRSQVVGNEIGLCAQPGPEAEYKMVVESTEKMFHELFGPEEWFARKPEVETFEEDQN